MKIMADEFDHILKQLLANLPEHSPKSEVWNNISSHIDEDVAMTRLRRILKNSEHQPKSDLWPAIETSLNKTVFWNNFFRSAWVKFVAPAVVVISVFVFVQPFLNNNQKLSSDGLLRREVKSSDIFNKNNNPISANNLSDVKFPLTVMNGSNNESGDYSKTNVQQDGNSESIKNNNSFMAQSSENAEAINSFNIASNKNTSNFSLSTFYKAPVSRFTTLLFNPLSGLIQDENQKTNRIIVTGLYTDYTSSISSGRSFGKPDFSMEVSYSPELSFLNLSDNGANDYGIDVNLRKQAELPSYSFSAGVEGRIDFRHFFVQTGLGYSRISTLSQYRYQHSSLDTLGWTLEAYSYVYSYDDGTGNIVDTCYISYSWSPLTAVVTVDEVKKTSFQIDYMQIPIIFGYGKDIGRMQYSLALGASVAVPISVAGKMLETDNYSISSVDKQYLPMKQTLYNGVLRLGVNYFVSPHYSVFAQPSLRYTLNSVFEKSYPVNQKYLTYGLRFGVAYRF